MSKSNGGQVKRLEFELRQDLKQRDLEAWNTAYMLLPRVGAASMHGAAVRAAVHAGWFAAPAVEYKAAGNGQPAQYLIDGVDVPDMHPAHVFQLGEAIDALYVRLTTIPKN